MAEGQLASLHIADKRETLKSQLQADEYLKRIVTTFVVTVNDGLADVVKGEDMYTYLLWGDGYIYEKLLYQHKNNENPIETNFRVSPFSFFQTNTL